MSGLVPERRSLLEISQLNQELIEKNRSLLRSWISRSEGSAADVRPEGPSESVGEDCREGVATPSSAIINCI